MTPLYKNQTVEIRIDTDNATLGAATVTRILYSKPGTPRVEGYWPATISGTELRYTTDADDLDRTGQWWFQPYLEFSGLKKYGQTIIRQVVSEPII